MDRDRGLPAAKHHHGVAPADALPRLQATDLSLRGFNSEVISAPTGDANWIHWDEVDVWFSDRIANPGDLPMAVLKSQSRGIPHLPPAARLGGIAAHASTSPVGRACRRGQAHDDCCIHGEVATTNARTSWFDAISERLIFSDAPVALGALAPSKPGSDQHLVRWHRWPRVTESRSTARHACRCGVPPACETLTEIAEPGALRRPCASCRRESHESTGDSEIRGSPT